jgi:hypothetical protein
MLPLLGFHQPCCQETGHWEWYAREWCAMFPFPEPDEKTASFAPFTAALFWFAGWDPIHCPGWKAEHRIRFRKVIFLVVMRVS